ncbi:hypothetical protein Q4566_12945 [Tamlana sp. 2_MG-2023]|uniref:hypothetical protein n=1 Tax=unclassified Tamlana TaxID=2614803 RepID=UPI0026E3F6BF|nr:MULTISPECIES: hypothetical protein [unclassified Tamlana]MDO6761111.1 hypothetical protein [Tamlana sp. 2_MG-2023]MDO6791556.1 hypothetical protein [Tamlana sp. 1_MG-2023]
MKKNLINIGVLSLILAFTSCSSDDVQSEGEGTPPEEDSTRWITITGSFPDDNGTGGNGGTRAFALTEEDAADPTYELNLFKIENGNFVEGIGLKSSRTARVQASENGEFLYNIQYTGTEGGVFNKYAVNGEADFEEVGYELNTAAILGTAPRWMKAAEGIGIGVYASTYDVEYEGEAPNFDFIAHDSEVKIALLDLENTAITNTAIFDFPWTDEERAAGYSVGRVDVPILNEAQTKLFIGCRVRKLDPTATPELDEDGNPSWPSDDINGTKTLVVDFPSLRNPTYITSTLSTEVNNAYRTMTQYIGSDGHIYQATATGGAEILRINSTTSDYDSSFYFNLNDVLGLTGARIRAWRYVKDGIGVVLYTSDDAEGGYIALIDLHNPANSVKLSTDVESDPELESTLGQFQNIGLIGDIAYVPLTPSGKEGAIYVINTVTKEIKKGAQLKTISGSYYLGAY